MTAAEVSGAIGASEQEDRDSRFGYADTPDARLIRAALSACSEHTLGLVTIALHQERRERRRRRGRASTGGHTVADPATRPAPAHKHQEDEP